MGHLMVFDGTIEKVNEEKRKLEVMVKIFGRKNTIRVKAICK
jgi:transcription antitermination protein nusG